MEDGRVEAESDKDLQDYALLILSDSNLPTGTSPARNAVPTCLMILTLSFLLSISQVASSLQQVSSPIPHMVS